MNRTLTRTSIIDDLFKIPDRVLVLYNPATGKYGCLATTEQGVRIDGLACFAQSETAIEFAYNYLLEHVPGLTLKSVNFDEAREIAKERELDAVIYFKDLGSPEFHYLR